jgi:hypothetical protein
MGLNKNIHPTPSVIPHVAELWPIQLDRADQLMFIPIRLRHHRYHEMCSYLKSKGI